MRKRYVVGPAGEERASLERLIAAGTAPARKLTHARILLKADAPPRGPGWVDDGIAEAVEVSQPTVARVRRQYAEQGPEAALNRRAPRREHRRKLDGGQEARLIAAACGKPPDGRARRTPRLPADKLVELDVVDDVSYQAARRVLKKTRSSRG